MQWCWAHLKRDFQALIDSPDRQVQRLGRDLMRPTKELFRLWARCRDGTITRRGFERLMQPIRKEIDGLILRGIFSGNPRLTGMCWELRNHRDWLWTFLEVDGIEPTNNAAERALRNVPLPHSAIRLPDRSAASLASGANSRSAPNPPPAAASSRPC